MFRNDADAVKLPAAANEVLTVATPLASVVPVCAAAAPPNENVTASPTMGVPCGTVVSVAVTVVMLPAVPEIVPGIDSNAG